MILWGEGYGSRLALAYLAEYGGRVERAILHAPRRVHKTVTGPLALESVLREVEDAFPGLIADLEQLLADLATRPAPPRVPLLQPGAEGDLVLRDSEIGVLDVQQAVAWSLLDRRLLRRLMNAVSRMLAGDFRLVSTTVADQTAPDCDVRGASSLQMRRVAIRGECVGSALTYAANCALLGGGDRIEKLDRQAARTRLGRALEFPYPEICETWDVPRSRRFDGCDEGLCPTEAVPVLLVTATLDPYSSSGDARRVGVRLRRILGRHAAVSTVEIRNGTRADLFDPRLASVLADFFAGDDARDYPPVTVPLE